jgi:hypothetical protein
MQIARLAYSKSTTKNAMLALFERARGPISAIAEPDPFASSFTDPATGNKVGVVDPCGHRHRGPGAYGWPARSVTNVSN